jgi:hypothetical protein
MPPLKLLRGLRIDIDALEAAFDGEDLDVSRYLDTETGEVVALTDRQIARARNAVPGAREGSEADDRARQVLAGVGTRFVPTPVEDRADAWSDMRAFVAQIEDPDARRRMRRVLRGTPSSYRFYVALDETVGLDEWYVWQHERRRARIVDWLASFGIAAWYETD